MRTLEEVLTQQLQWFFWGFSLTFSDTGSPVIGNLSELSSTSSFIRRSQLCRVFCSEGCPSGSIYGQFPNTINRILYLSAYVCCNYVRNRFSSDHSKCLTRAPIQTHVGPRRICRACPSWSTPCLCLRLVNSRLRSYCLLDVEC